MNFNLSELAFLIRLVEGELNVIHETIENGDDQEADDASEMSVIAGEVSAKLQELYESNRRVDSNYPSYEELTK